MNLAKTIRNAREDQGIMVSEVARRAGLTTAGVMAIESGRVRNPGIETVVKIAHALGVDVGAMLKEAEAGSASPKVIALPSTPVTDTSEVGLDFWLKTTGSAAEIDKRLRAVEAEARDLEEFYPRRIAPKLDRARLYQATILHRWLQMTDKRRDPASNRFKSVSEIAEELGARYVSEESHKKKLPREIGHADEAS